MQFPAKTIRFARQSVSFIPFLILVPGISRNGRESFVTNRKWFQVDLWGQWNEFVKRGRRAKRATQGRSAAERDARRRLHLEPLEKRMMLAADVELALPRVSIFATDNRAAETGVGIAADTGTFTISRTGPTDAPLQVRFGFGGSAASGADYTPLSATVSIPAGASSADVTVRPVDDTIQEAPETVNGFILSSPNSTAPTYVVGTSSAVVTIDDNDLQAATAIVQLTTVDSQATETPAGQPVDRGELRISRSGPLDAPLTVNLRSTGSATGGVDYASLPTTFTLAAGQVSASLFVDPIDDVVGEWPEYVQVQLQPAVVSGSTLPFYVVDANRMAGTVSVNDNDTPRVGIVATDNRAAETAAGLPVNEATFTLTRTGDVSAALTVNYRTSGTAASASDYVALPGTVTFAAGASTAIVALTPVDDSVIEQSEYVSISLLPPTSGGVTTSVPAYSIDPTKGGASATIDDDDILNLPRVSIVTVDNRAAETVAGQNSNGGQLIVSRTGATDAPLTVQYRVYGSATSGVDYQPLAGSSGTGTSITGSITIPAGAATAALDVNVIDDSAVEFQESVSVQLQSESSVVNGVPVVPTYLLATSSTYGYVTIDDNDTPVVSLAVTDNRAAETIAGDTPNSGLFSFSRTGSTANPLTVNYRIYGNAVMGVDYEAIPGATLLASTNSSVTVTGSITIPAGESSVGVPVNILDDSVYEFSESLSINLSSATYVAGQPSAYLIDNAKSFGSITIDDNDQNTQTKVSIVATDNRAAETAAGQTANPGQFVISRTGATTAPLTVGYRVYGNAVHGTDYEALPGATVSTTTSGTNSYTTIVGNVTIPAGESTVAININPIDDAVYELAESISLSLVGPSSTVVGGTVVPPTYGVDYSKSSAYVTIDDNDQATLPRVSVVATDNRAAETGGTQTANTGTYVISRTGATDADLVVAYRMYGNAVAGTDYQSLPGTVTIPAGESSVAVSLNVIDDSVVEYSESAILSLSSSPAVGGIPRYLVDNSKSSAAVTIDDDDFQQLPRISVVAADSRAAETAAGAAANPGQFVFSRTGATDAPLTVAYRVYGSATAGADYQTLAGSVTFAAGESTAAVNVDVIDDSVIEFSEYVAVNLVNAATAAGSVPTYQFNSSQAFASVTIADDDSPVVSLTVTDNRAAEITASQTVNSGQVVVSRSGSTSAPLNVTYRIYGSAVNGVDYESLPNVTASTTVNGTTSITTLTGTVTIPAGESSVALNISAIDDSVYEYSESVSISLASAPAIAGSPAPYAIDYSKSSGNVTIDDNDQASQAKVSVVATDANAAEVAAGQAANDGIFTIARSGATDADLTVYYRVEGTATAGSDYTALGGSVVIPAGQSSVQINLAVLDDANVEASETVRLVLLNPPQRSGLPPIYAIDYTKPTATVTIADDDTATTTGGGSTNTTPSSSGTTSRSATDSAKLADAVFAQLGLGVV